MLVKRTINKEDHSPIVEENILIARKWFQWISDHNIDALSSITDAHWILHGGPKGLQAGPEGIKQLFETTGPVQQRWIIEDIIAVNNKVVVRAINSCVQEQFMGIPAKGKWQIFSAIFIHRIENGKVKETWRNADDLGRIIQLGVRIHKYSRPNLGSFFGFNSNDHSIVWDPS